MSSASFLVALAVFTTGQDPVASSNLTRVAFSSLRLVGEFWKGGLVVDGVVEICPRNPPYLLAIGNEVLVSANGTIWKTLDKGLTWTLGTRKTPSFTPVVPAAPWLRAIWPDARWMDVQPFGAYPCWTPGHTGVPCAPVANITAAPNKEYIDWGTGEMLRRTLGRPRPLTWTGLPSPVSEFCTSCGRGVQLKNGSYVYIVVVWNGPNWRADNHSVMAPCCNNSVVAFYSDDGLDWRYVGTVAAYNNTREYQEGPNECDLVLLKDGKTLWAVMRVDGGDGYPDRRTLPLIAATSTDGGFTWVPAVTPKEMRSAWPRAVVLDNGALLVTVGRPGVDLFVSLDGMGRTWVRHSLPTVHNRLVASEAHPGAWSFCPQFEQAAANQTFANATHRGWMQSDGYLGVAAMPNGQAMVCYDRMGISQGPYQDLDLPCWSVRRNYTECAATPWPDGWGLPYGCGLDHSTTFCMRVFIS